MRLSQSEYEDVQRRLDSSKKVSGKAVDAPLESRLHEQIEAELKRRRLYYVHSRMDRATTTQLGVTDFIIAAPNGITYWIEAKRKGGKLTPEQTITKHILTALNHRYATVYSFDEFLEITSLA